MGIETQIEKTHLQLPGGVVGDNQDLLDIHPTTRETDGEH